MNNANPDNIMKTISPQPIVYRAVYKNKIDIGVIITPVVLFLISAINIRPSFTDIYSGVFKNFWEDIFWLAVVLLSLLKLVWILTGRFKFTITNGKLVINSGVFIKRSKVYTIDNMEDIDAEQVKIRTIFPADNKPTNDKILTFFYNAKEVALGFDLKDFDAVRLKEELLAQKISA